MLYVPITPVHAGGHTSMGVWVSILPEPLACLQQRSQQAVAVCLFTLRAQVTGLCPQLSLICKVLGKMPPQVPLGTA